MDNQQHRSTLDNFKTFCMYARTHAHHARSYQYKHVRTAHRHATSLWSVVVVVVAGAWCLWCFLSINWLKHFIAQEVDDIDDLLQLALVVLCHSVTSIDIQSTCTGSTLSNLWAGGASSSSHWHMDNLHSVIVVCRGVCYLFRYITMKTALALEQIALCLVVVVVAVCGGGCGVIVAMRQRWFN